jgi:hypothetical protein
VSEAESGAPDTGSDTDWRTPAESSAYRTTPNYAETLAFLERLVRAYPTAVRMEGFGRTGEGHELKVVICSRDGVFDPLEIHASGRVVLLVQNSIHAGEMDGKDACLALVRDLVRDARSAELLRNVALVFIPVYNVDGHERRSPYHRINQNGPESMGWRANGTNLSLNRDYMKADAPETRAFLRLIQRWAPDFFVDDHVTDGADFAYDVTFHVDATPNVAPETAAWVRTVLIPELERRVNNAGHLALPALVNLVDDTDPAQGLACADNPPRFSTGYMILENRPGLLVELHMLKDYRTRVGANYATLRALLEILSRDAAVLRRLNEAADRGAADLLADPSRREAFPLRLAWNGETTPLRFRGRHFTRFASDISGAMSIRYDTDPWEASVEARTGVKVVLSIRVPAGYIIPPQWTPVIDVLAAHAVTMRRTLAEWTGPVGQYWLSGMEWPSSPFEGRFPILAAGNVESAKGNWGTCELSDATETFPAGSVVIPLDQRLAQVAVHWLEPEAPDSALRWGFFSPIFEQKESGEAYVVERLAADDLAHAPALRAEFERRLDSDPSFARSPSDRLEFFYRRSPWGRANLVGKYPVGRLGSLAGLPLA